MPRSFTLSAWGNMKTKASEKAPIIYIVGATASGKTDLAIRLAKHLKTEIISADSRYLYKEINIGTAKPTLEERGQISHHLIDVSSVQHIWSLGEYLKAVGPIIQSIHKQNKIAILVGGTGQYYRAIVEGWQPPELPPNPGLRSAIEVWGDKIGTDALHQKLALIDPSAAVNIDARNVRRTVRAWEVIFSTGNLFSEQRSRSESPYNTLMIGLDWDRESLYQRIDQRIDLMLDEGLLEEAQNLIDQGLADFVKKIGVIGYAESFAYLENEIDLNTCKMLIKRHTRQYVRRQANWFKPSDKTIHWFKATDPAHFEKMLSLIEENFAIRR